MTPPRLMDRSAMPSLPREDRYSHLASPSRKRPLSDPDDLPHILRRPRQSPHVSALTQYRNAFGRHRESIRSASFSASGNFAVTCCQDPKVYLWHAHSRGNEPLKCLEELSHDDQVLQAFVSDDGKNVVTSCADGAVRFWDLTGYKPSSVALRRPLYRNARACQITPDGSFSVAAFYLGRRKKISKGRMISSFASTVVLLDERGRVSFEVKYDGKADMCRMSHDASVIAVGFSGVVPNPQMAVGNSIILLSSTGREIHTVENCLRYDPLCTKWDLSDSGLELAVISDDLGYVKVYEGGSGSNWDKRPIILSCADISEYHSLRFADHGRLVIAVASTSYSKTIRVFNVQTRSVLFELYDVMENNLPISIEPRIRRVTTISCDYDEVRAICKENNSWQSFMFTSQYEIRPPPPFYQAPRERSKFGRCSSHHTPYCLSYHVSKDDNVHRHDRLTSSMSRSEPPAGSHLATEKDRGPLQPREERNEDLEPRLTRGSKKRLSSSPRSLRRGTNGESTMPRTHDEKRPSRHQSAPTTDSLSIVKSRGLATLVRQSHVSSAVLARAQSEVSDLSGDQQTRRSKSSAPAPLVNDKIATPASAAELASTLERPSRPVMITNSTDVVHPRSSVAMGEEDGSPVVLRLPSHPAMKQEDIVTSGKGCQLDSVDLGMAECVEDGAVKTNDTECRARGANASVLELEEGVPASKELKGAVNVLGESDVAKVSGIVPMDIEDGVPKPVGLGPVHPLPGIVEPADVVSGAARQETSSTRQGPVETSQGRRILDPSNPARQTRKPNLHTLLESEPVTPSAINQAALKRAPMAEDADGHNAKSLSASIREATEPLSKDCRRSDSLQVSPKNGAQASSSRLLNEASSRGPTKGEPITPTPTTCSPERAEAPSLSTEESEGNRIALDNVELFNSQEPKSPDPKPTSEAGPQKQSIAERQAIASDLREQNSSLSCIEISGATNRETIRVQPKTTCARDAVLDVTVSPAVHTPLENPHQISNPILSSSAPHKLVDHIYVDPRAVEYIPKAYPSVPLEEKPHLGQKESLSASSLLFPQVGWPVKADEGGPMDAPAARTRLSTRKISFRSTRNVAVPVKPILPLSSRRSHAGSTAAALEPFEREGSSEDNIPIAQLRRKVPSRQVPKKKRVTRSTRRRTPVSNPVPSSPPVGAPEDSAVPTPTYSNGSSEQSIPSREPFYASSVPFVPNVDSQTEGDQIAIATHENTALGTVKTSERATEHLVLVGTSLISSSMNVSGQSSTSPEPTLIQGGFEGLGGGEEQDCMDRAFGSHEGSTKKPAVKSELEPESSAVLPPLPQTHPTVSSPSAPHSTEPSGKRSPRLNEAMDVKAENETVGNANGGTSAVVGGVEGTARYAFQKASDRVTTSGLRCLTGAQAFRTMAELVRSELGWEGDREVAQVVYGKTGTSNLCTEGMFVHAYGELFCCVQLLRRERWEKMFRASLPDNEEALLVFHARDLLKQDVTGKDCGSLPGWSDEDIDDVFESEGMGMLVNLEAFLRASERVMCGKPEEQPFVDTRV